MRDSVVVGNTGTGIRVAASADTEVVGNNVSANAGNGVWLLGSTGVTVVGNTLTRNGLYGVAVEADSTGNSIYDNVFVWNQAGNALDACGDNRWDDGTRTGNMWAPYDGRAKYIIPGPGHAVDNFPRPATPVSPVAAALTVSGSVVVLVVLPVMLGLWGRRDS